MSEEFSSVASQIGDGLFGGQSIVEQVAVVSIGILLSLVAAKASAVIWTRILNSLAERPSNKVGREMVVRTRFPVGALTCLFGLYLTVEFSRYLFDVERSRLLDGLERVIFSLAVLGVAALGTGLLRAALDWYVRLYTGSSEVVMSKEFVPLIERTSSIVIFFVAAMTILAKFGVPIESFLATAGVASLAVALAAQETIANMISGLTIMVDRPFRVGDRIQLQNGETGDVYEIGLRTTKILSFDNTLIIIPNSEIAKSQLTNLSYPDQKVKVRQAIGVAYGSDIDFVKSVILEVCRAHPEVLKEPAPSVFFTGFGESSLDLLVVFWVGDYREQFRVADEINTQINRRFAEEGIVIPFPQREVHILDCRDRK